MTINNPVKSSDRHWNGKQFIQLSNILGAAYNPGLNGAKSDLETDVWTTDKFIAMSRNFSSAYGVDL